MAQEVDRVVPTWATVVRRLLAADTEHLLVADDGAHVPVQVRKGVMQGGPLSPLLFALGIDPAIRTVDGALQQVGAGREVTAYMDDVDVFTPTPMMPHVLAAAGPAFAQAGLRLNATKTTYWRPEGAADPAFASPVTRGHLPVARVRQPTTFRVPVDAGAPGTPEATAEVWNALLRRRQRARTRLQLLVEAGLGRHQGMCLLRMLAPADVTFHLRTLPADAATLARLDDTVATAAAAIVRRSAPLDPTHLRWSRLPLREGGLGIPDSARTAPAARLASTVAALPTVARVTGATSLEDLTTRAPLLAARLEGLTATLAQEGLETHDEVRLGLTQPRRHLQRLWGHALAEASRDALLDELPLPLRALLRAAGGPGAGAWLLPAEEGEEWMPDDEFAVAVHLRMALPLHRPPACAACVRAGVPAAQAQHDQLATHALCCSRGPGHVSRHERVKHAWARVLEDALGAPPQLEQVVPEWATPDGREARLDLSFALPGGRTRHADVTVGHPSGRGSVARSAASRDGGLALALERTKRTRYPHPELVPLALESGGRMGPSALALMRALHAPLPPDERVVAMRRAYRRVATALQRAQAQTALRAPQPGAGVFG